MKKISLILVFTLLISLVCSLEFESILSISEDSRSVTSQDSVLYLAIPDGISIYDYSNQSLDLVKVFNPKGYHNLEYNAVTSSENYLINHPQVNAGAILYDITDRFNPQEVYIFDNNSLKDMQEYQGLLYVLLDSLYVYDPTNFSLEPTTLLSYRSKFSIADDKLITLTISYGESYETAEAEIELYEFNSPTDIQFIDSYQLSHSGMGTYMMVVQNQRVFIREDGALNVFDYSEGLELTDTIDSLFTSGSDPIYSKANESVLVSLDGYYWDISDVDNIVTYEGWDYGVWSYFAKSTFIGNHFFKANWDDGLVIADFSDIENVELIYNWNSYKNIVGIDIVGNTLLDLAFPKLKMFDVSDSDNIQELSVLAEEEWNTGFDDYLIGEDKLLLAHDEYMTILSTENGVSQPEYCADINLGSIGQIAYYGDHIYNIDESNLQMQITDISQAETPEILGSVDVDEIIYAPISSYVIEHYLLLVNENLRVSIYDLNTPQAEYLSSFSLNTVMSTAFTADDVKFIVKDNLLYASLYKNHNYEVDYIPSIFIFDITEIEDWQLLNTIHFDDVENYDFEISGNYLYTVKEWNTHFKMFEIDSVGNYTEVASYNDVCTLSGSRNSMKIHNNKLYLSHRENLTVYNIIYYTENDSYEIVPSNQISSYNYPNPFNPETRISYDITKKGNVTVDIYNLKGQKVKSLLSEKQEAGKHNVVWYGDNDSGKQVSSGTYLYRVKNGEKKVVKKMLLVK